ncbi:hypothetical protein [Pseudomonas amygdali]|uniref:hypothetical protein n=1 Tax=Pseudomonas amygdali TaxID=47877 RepID=UPI003453B530
MSLVQATLAGLVSPVSHVEIIVLGQLNAEVEPFIQQQRHQISRRIVGIEKIRTPNLMGQKRMIRLKVMKNGDHIGFDIAVGVGQWDKVVRKILKLLAALDRKDGWIRLFEEAVPGHDDSRVERCLAFPSLYG